MLAEPVRTVTCPDGPPAALPELKLIMPLAPALSEPADAMDTAPLLVARLCPLTIETDPPVESLLTPAVADIEPPLPLVPDPTVKLNAPPEPALAAPVPIEIAPEQPL